MTEDNRHKFNLLNNKKAQWTIIILAILVYISFFIPIPYYITMPGSAVDLSTVIEVEDGYQERGSFMLTTVSMMPATVPTYIYSKFDPYAESFPEEYILNENEDQEDYNNRQLKVMQQSQDDAIIAAFDYLDIPINISQNGVMVMGIAAGAPSEEVLQVGDLITGIDNNNIQNTDDLLNYLQPMQAGERVELTFLRDEKIYNEEVELIDLSDQIEEDVSEDEEEDGILGNKAGIGIYPYDEREITPSKEVHFNTEDIGGPSAGLMFALEIVNRLTPEDLTKGYQIAGTGTLDAEGNVGQIGGASLKVKAAYESGAEIFFVPMDIYEEDVNQKEAEEANKDLGNPMQIVPVATLDEAIQFLENLPLQNTP